jgi:soluble lytic murein transglycosylase-like protein
MLIGTGRRRSEDLRYIVFVLVLGVAAPASAQIYSWRDEGGTLVVSNTPRGVAVVRSYSVPSAESVRATRYVAPGRSRQYDGLIAEHSSMNGVRTDLVRAVIQVESGFNPNARSPKGALGLMQLMPGTAREFGVRNAFNPAENIRAGVAYLRRLLDRYANNEVLALAAYNAGPTAVDRYGENVPPYRETQNYVSKINRIAGETTRVPGTQLYKSVDVTPDGREIPKYTDKKPN